MSEKRIWRSFLPLSESGSDADLELRGEGGDIPMLRGLAAAYEKWSLDLGGFRELIQPGAFDKVLAKKSLDVVALFDHAGQPLGRLKSGTLRLSVDERGLSYEVDLPDTQLGRDVATLVRRRDLFGSSFAFTVDDEGQSWIRDAAGNRKRIIHEFSGLFDVSVVTHAAYGDATSVAMRALELELERSEELRRQAAAAAARAAAAAAKVRYYAG